jgi:hypothetical protein
MALPWVFFRCGTKTEIVARSAVYNTFAVATAAGHAVWLIRLRANRLPLTQKMTLLVLLML